MSKICKYLVAFMLVFALFMGACGVNTGNGSGNGGNGGDVYKDYEANIDAFTRPTVYVKHILIQKIFF